MLPPKESRIQGVEKHDGVEVEGLSSAVEQESRDLPENAPSLMVHRRALQRGPLDALGVACGEVYYDLAAKGVADKHRTL